MYKIGGFPGTQQALRFYQGHLLRKAKNNPAYRGAVIKQLRSCIERFAQLFALENRADLTKNMLLFETFAHDQSVYGPLLSDPLVLQHMDETRAFWQTVETKMEKDSANELLNGSPNLVNDIVRTHYGYVEREGLAAGIGKNSKVLLMGGGSLPFTAIALHKFFGVTCTCIDIDPEAIDLSKKVISRLGLESAITIESGNATDYPIHDYDLIVVTAHCMPKEEVFSHINREAKPSVRVLYREPVGLHKLIYYNNPDPVAHGFTKTRIVHPGKGEMVESVVLMKRAQQVPQLRASGYFPDSRMELVDVKLKNGQEKTLRFEIFPCQYVDGNLAWESLRDAVVDQSRGIFGEFVDAEEPGYDKAMVEATLKETSDGLVGVIWDQEKFVGLSVVGWMETPYGRTQHLMLSQLEHQYRISKIIPYSLVRLINELSERKGIQLWQKTMVSFDSPNPFVLGNLSTIMTDPYPDPRNSDKQPSMQQRKIGAALAKILFPGFEFDDNLFVVKGWYEDHPGLIFAPDKVPQHKEPRVNDFCNARLRYDLQGGDKFLGIGTKRRIFMYTYLQWLRHSLNAREI